MVRTPCKNKRSLVEPRSGDIFIASRALGTRQQNGLRALSAEQSLGVRRFIRGSVAATPIRVHSQPVATKAL